MQPEPAEGSESEDEGADEAGPSHRAKRRPGRAGEVRVLFSSAIDPKEAEGLAKVGGRRGWWVEGGVGGSWVGRLD